MGDFLHCYKAAHLLLMEVKDEIMENIHQELEETGIDRHDPRRLADIMKTNDDRLLTIAIDTLLKRECKERNWLLHARAIWNVMRGSEAAIQILLHAAKSKYGRSPRKRFEMLVAWMKASAPGITPKRAAKLVPLTDPHRLDIVTVREVVAPSGLLDQTDLMNLLMSAPLRRRNARFGCLSDRVQHQIRIQQTFACRVAW